jgi:hypothetical protein
MSEDRKDPDEKPLPEGVRWGYYPAGEAFRPLPHVPIQRSKYRQPPCVIDLPSGELRLILERTVAGDDATRWCTHPLCPCPADAGQEAHEMCFVGGCGV